MEHLILNLEAPMLSFGSPMVDHRGPTSLFPAKSAITGLIGNALGITRTEHEKLQAIQDHMVLASRIDRPPPNHMATMDYQTVELHPKEEGWTTSGTPEGRTGSKQTLENYHLRFREYLADTKVTAAVRLGRYRGCQQPNNSQRPSTTPTGPSTSGENPSSRQVPSTKPQSKQALPWKQCWKPVWKTPKNCPPTSACAGPPRKAFPTTSRSQSPTNTS